MRSLAIIMLNVLTKGVALFSLTEKKEKLNDFSEGDSLLSLDKLLKIPSEISDIRNEIANIIDEINMVHKSVANLRPDIRQAIRQEVTAALNAGIYRS